MMIKQRERDSQSYQYFSPRVIVNGSAGQTNTYFEEWIGYNSSNFESISSSHAEFSIEDFYTLFRDF